jgi:hypothetical protein
MPELPLDVVIRARDALKSGFSSAGQTLRKWNAQFAAGTGGSIDATLRLLAGVQKVRIALDAATVGVQLWNGEFEKVDQTLLRLPFGLGEIYRAEKELAEAVAEWWDPSIKHTRAMIEAGKEELSQAREKIKLATKLRAIMEPTLVAGQLAGLPKDQQSILRAELENKKRLKELLDLQYGEDRDNLEGLIPRAEFDKALQASAKIRTAEIRAVREEQEKADKKMLAERDEAWNKANAELHESRLRAIGKQMEAEIAAIREVFRVRRAASKSAAETEAIDQLERNRIDEVERAARARRQITSHTVAAGPLLTDRYQGLAAQKRLIDDQQLQVWDRIARMTAEQVAQLKLVVETLKRGWNPELGALILRLP